MNLKMKDRNNNPIELGDTDSVVINDPEKAVIGKVKV